ncbi:flagellar hook-associated protein FlgK [Clostridium estertheticum]|uniref:Flagellar hook-associated protein 1 n=1 Tax=Clostridium estertheticum TaxID=238834 RepID=A0A5N7IQI5_9CLOT|nr:flagellar hook-associated protein FlgK [Clostridium estertheticum]MPQ32568.1 flagellar hook-associated protein FlgK [Clostridium estertheticum]MPQ63227.1 flagellar hook-associated protein FlgK [Clostridium estertheticum]
MSGLYSTMNVAVRGMTAQQGAIDVTSHNIANANTDGYSRQRATMETTTPFGMPSMNNAIGPGQLGTGVQISSITRIRDSYLDYQIRDENGALGLNQGKEEFLSKVETVFNGVSETGVSKLIGKVFDSWQALSTSPELSSTRTVVAQQSKALTDELNSTYNQLSTLKGDCNAVIKQDVVDINSMLNQVDELNQQIIKVKVGGNEPNDLMDKRDLLEDQLSTKFGIKIDKQSFGGQDIKVTDKDGNSTYLVKATSNTGVKRFYYDETTEKISLIDKDDVNIPPHSTIDYTPTTGELKGYMDVQTNIATYKNKLNSLAKSIAFSVNAVHDGSATSNDGIDDFFVNSTNHTTVGEAGITAGNITVNPIIIADTTKIKVGAGENPGKTDGTRALAIAQLRDVKFKIPDNSDGITTRAGFGNTITGGTTSLLTISSATDGSTIGGYFTKIVNDLAIQTQEATRTVKNHEIQLASLEQSRTSISGVSLDEEMANLIQYQHAYAANAKIISTVDELLDLIVNGLKK